MNLTKTFMTIAESSIRELDICAYKIKDMYVYIKPRELDAPIDFKKNTLHKYSLIITLKRHTI